MDFDMFLDQLKSRLRIEDVISEYVTLRKGSGSRFVGCARSIPKKRPLSPCLPTTSIFTASAAARAAI